MAIILLPAVMGACSTITFNETFGNYYDDACMWVSDRVVSIDETKEIRQLGPESLFMAKVLQLLTNYPKVLAYQYINSISGHTTFFLCCTEVRPTRAVFQYIHPSPLLRFAGRLNILRYDFIQDYEDYPLV